MVDIQDILNAGKVIPVLAYNGVDEAVRHPTALEAIKAVQNDLPNDAYVGVGTIMNPSLLKAAMDTGACFGVSPGLTPALAKAIKNSGWAFLPGTATLSEAMSAHYEGFNVLKFFPASASGGPSFLKAAGAVLPNVQYCPTGGVNPSNAQEYLSLGNVPVVGGSWIVARDSDGNVDQAKTGEKASALNKI